MFGDSYARGLLARTPQDLLRQFPRGAVTCETEDHSLAVVEVSRRAMRTLIRQDVPRRLLLCILRGVQVRSCSCVYFVQPVRLVRPEFSG
jgi:hypothetical protein